MWSQKLPVAETVSHLEPQVISQLNRTISILKPQLPIHSTNVYVVPDVLLGVREANILV